MHNSKFDTKFLLHNYKVETRGIFDTMLAERLLGGEFGQLKLQVVAPKYTGIELDKGIRESFWKGGTVSAFTEAQIAYAAQDSEVLIPIMEKQQKLLAEQGMANISELEFELAPIVADMELAGVPVDTDMWNKKLAKYREDHEKSRIRMHELLFDEGGLDEQMGMFTRDSINLGSPKQLLEAFQKIGINVRATNEREISRVKHPAAEELLNFRGLDKILKAYGTSFLDKIHPFSGRIHADYQQIGTETGRFSCKEPNLQQMPAELRHCVTLPDHKIVVADYPNIELRILAELSEDKMLTQAFESGHDPHKSTASLMFNIPIDNVSKEQRFIAKTINFGISYGMGIDKLFDMLNAQRGANEQLTYTQVKMLMSKYKNTYSRAAEWLASAGNLAYRRAYSETMMGRRRYFIRPVGDDDAIAAMKRKGANSPIQGTNADITKLGMVNLYRTLNDYYPSAKIILQVHDEVAVLAHKREAESVKIAVEESMTASAQEVLKKVPVFVEAVISDVWKKD